MRRKGVCYDVGRELEGRSWRPDFRPGQVRRELEIIARDLHCTAVRIQSADLSRLGWTAQVAMELGLEVWLSPDLWDHDAEDTLAHLVSAAGVAEEVRRAHAGRVVLSVGSELSLFMLGVIPGDTLPERIARPDLDSLLRAETTQRLADRGGSGFDITDHSGDQPHIKGDYVRDEAGQAREITECLDIFDAGGADTAFVQTFVQPTSPWNPDPRFDFDLASYSLVRSFASRVGDLAKEFPKVPWDTTDHGTTYPDMPWEPKESFHAVAAWNAAH